MSGQRRARSIVWLIAALGLAGCDGRSPSTHDAAAASSANAGNSMQQSPPVAAPETAVKAAFDQEYAGLLADVVTEDGLVRYELIAQPQREVILKRVVDRIAAAPLPSRLEEKLAFCCNAYNANVLLMALHESRKPGFVNVKELPGFFDKMMVTVAGTETTLNDLENEIRQLHDPRVHCALVCAAMSCPPLRNEPYVADQIHDQLNEQCRRWVEDDMKNGMRGRQLSLSEIFKWYEDDFKVQPYGDYLRFVHKFARPAGKIRDFINHRQEDSKIIWTPYDWSLNQAKLPIAAPHLQQPQ